MREPQLLTQAQNTSLDRHSHVAFFASALSSGAASSGGSESFKRDSSSVGLTQSLNVVQDLTGLANCAELRELHLHGNRIRSLAGIQGTLQAHDASSAQAHVIRRIVLIPPT